MSSLFKDDPDFSNPPPAATPGHLPPELPAFAQDATEHANTDHPDGPLHRRTVQADPAIIDATFAGAEAMGIICPRCHCPDMRVGSTIRHDGAVRRYRYCRACGRGLPTEELSAAELANLRRLANQ